MGWPYFKSEMAAESEAVGTAQVGSAGLNMASADVKNSPSSNSQGVASVRSYGHIRLDISNSVLPREKLVSSPSINDGLAEDTELQIRSLGCELIQLAGKLLRLPQVAMATGCVLFQRFYYAKSLVRIPFDIVAMACVCLACKIEEAPRRIRDIINVFNHIKQVRSGKPIVPMVLDVKYIALKDEIIKAERRVLKELGFCVHVKHPHKIIVMYLKWLELDSHRELLQMSWNFMNDSLRTDVFVRYPPETIAVACIYLSARKLKEPLPKNPSWFEVLGVEEDDIKDCCYRMICLYNRQKSNQEELESIVDGLRKKLDEERRALREYTNAQNTPSQSSPASRSGSPIRSQDSEADHGHEKQKNGNAAGNGNNGNNAQQIENSRENETSMSPSKKSKKHKHKQRSRSRSRSYGDRDYYRNSNKSKKMKSSKRGGSMTRSPSSSPPPRKREKHRHGHHKEKMRHRSRSRDRNRGGGRGSVTSIGLHDDDDDYRDRDRRGVHDDTGGTARGVQGKHS